MILTTTIIISALVAFNFLLLKFSCNKVKKATNKNRTPIVLKPQSRIQTLSPRLAATGS
ncbi:hypothetical protein KO493_14615 [Tamlana agarivorans]|uniref:Uncharacterized protein n=1 Tax=Pseudotamlana agarivorans TaxID=481183 RepID=A0ACC5UCC2_9FLAO|nr:hypothetical protein [Tamlana agarivorans]MBU2951930.1 hypothetical protein [Tamlana agarivorans]